MSEPTDRRRPRGWILPIALLGAVALLLTVVFTMQSGPQDPVADEVPAGGQSPQEDPEADETTAPGPAPDPSALGPPARVEGPPRPEASAIERRDAEEILTAGPVDAPVALVVFSDYQCPFCAQWSQDTLPAMMEYAEAGDLRIEWRDVNIFGEESERAARASYAAALQGNFWQYHDALFPDGQIRSHRQLDDEGLTALAADLGLDTDQFETDLHHPETAEQIERNAQLGMDLGAYSTPSFVLAGEPIVGAQPTEVFTDAVDAALARSGD